MTSPLPSSKLMVSDADPDAPLFSVISATYNCREKLRLTLDSVLCQDDACYEYVVVDGNSSDGTLDEIQSRGDRVRWISEKDDGVYDAMNKGIRMARGRFLYFIGAGDTLRPDALRRVAACIAAGGLAHSREPVFLYGDVFSEAMGKVYGGPFNKIKIGLFNICHQAIFYDRRIFQRLDGYDLQYRILADHELNLRCFGANWLRKVRIDEVVADYEAAGLSSASDEVFCTAQASLIRKHLGLISLLAMKLRFRFPVIFEKWMARRG